MTDDSKPTTVLRAVFAGVPTKAYRILGRRWPQDVGNPCALCGGTGYTEVNGEMHQCICALMSRAPRARATKREIEGAYGNDAHAVGLSEKQRDAAIAIRDAVLGDNPPRFVVVSGPTASGKTFLASWIYERFGPFGAWIAPDAMRDTRHVNSVLGLIRKPPLVVIDDIGEETTGTARWHKEALFAIVNARSNLRGGYALTVVTTNLSPSGFASISDRLQSRFSTKRGAMWVMLGDTIAVKEAQQWKP